MSFSCERGAYPSYYHRFQNVPALCEGSLMIYGVLQKNRVVPRSCGDCGGAVDSIFSVFAQLHRSSLEFETLLESV